MGVDVTVVSDNFFIPGENLAALVNAILPGNIFGEADLQEVVLDSFGDEGFDVDMDEYGNVYSISAVDGSFRLHDQDSFFQQIAQFVKDGSWIEMDANYGEGPFRWVFKNGQMHEIEPVITWPEVQ
jgi:hypothetical protein